MGAINVKHTGSGADIALSSDGTSLLLDGTAIGGGSDLELYAENPSSPTAPSATGTNSVAIGDSATAGGTRSIALGFNPTASATTSTAIGRGATASAQNATAIGNGSTDNAGPVAAGLSATSIGRAYASGTDSFAAAIASNSSSYGATGANSIALGRLSKATGSSSFAAGRNCIADASNAFSFGSFADNDGVGSRFSFGISGAIAAQQQTSFFTSEKTTSDATPVEIGFNDTYRHKLKNNSAHAFSGIIVARQQASQGTASAAWKIEGLIRREGSAGTTVLVNSATTVLDNTPAWGMALSANTTRGGLAITITGAAATNIRFVATINTSEVTY